MFTIHCPSRHTIFLLLYKNMMAKSLMMTTNAANWGGETRSKRLSRPLTIKTLFLASPWSVILPHISCWPSPRNGSENQLSAQPPENIKVAPNMTRTLCRPNRGLSYGPQRWVREIWPIREQKDKYVRSNLSVDNMMTPWWVSIINYIMNISG